MLVLEDIGIGNRLQRGRTYARKGQVISLEVAPGSVTAKVQGSRPRPYRVRIGIPAFGKAEWSQTERALAGIAVRGRPLTELLRPAYLTLGRTDRQ